MNEWVILILLLYEHQKENAVWSKDFREFLETCDEKDKNYHGTTSNHQKIRISACCAKERQRPIPKYRPLSSKK